VRESQAKALIAARAALEQHAEGVVVMDLRSLSSVTDFFVICTADTSRQLDAIQTHVETRLAERGCPVWHVEGSPSRAAPSKASGHELRWVLMDCGEIVVHLLDHHTRSFYRLEELWADAPRLPVEPVTRHPA
jgi:ribosome-associated protein